MPTICPQTKRQCQRGKLCNFDRCDIFEQWSDPNTCGKARVALIAATATPSKELRELRQWHATKYAQCERLRIKWEAGRFKSDKSKAEDYRRKASLHMKAVQALNDCFPVNDNAVLALKGPHESNS